MQHPSLASKLPDASSPTCALALERLRLAAHVGCTEQERARPQAVDVSVRLFLPAPPGACASDRLSDTLCLDAMAERLRAVAEAEPCALIERLAGRLLSALIERYPTVCGVELEVAKVAPPIAGLAGGTRCRLSHGRVSDGAGAHPRESRERSLLAQSDPLVYAAIRGEERRQHDGVELVPSENYTYPEVLAALGSVLTDKYAEGYPGRRYYAGNTYSDAVEELARERARKLFRAEHANVQPLSGSPMNQAVYLAFLEPGDTLLAMDLSHGGHLTHGAPVSHMGRLFRFVRYRTRSGDGRIDYDEVRSLAREARPKLILCGYTSYPRDYDYAAFRRIADEVGALTMADVSHVGGLIAGGALDNPFDHGFDVVTTTTHKTLRGPRAGLILCRREHARAVDRSVFPGLQGGPHMNTIAAVAVALGKALEPGFARYARAVLDNARSLASALLARGVSLVTSGTENHLMVLDSIQSAGIDGARAEQLLESAGITTNKQLVPDDPRPPLAPSGVRLGTPAVTTRGMGRAEMELLGGFIADVLRDPAPARLAEIRAQTLELCRRFPIPTAAPPSAAAQP